MFSLSSFSNGGDERRERIDFPSVQGIVISNPRFVSERKKKKIALKSSLSYVTYVIYEC